MLQKKYLDQIKKILWQHLDPKKDKTFIFGSWAVGDNRKFSDIDIGIKSTRKIPYPTIFKLKNAFEESNLPYTVDVVDFASTTKKFREVAKQATFPLN